MTAHPTAPQGAPDSDELRGLSDYALGSKRGEAAAMRVAAHDPAPWEALEDACMREMLDRMERRKSARCAESEADSDDLDRFRGEREHLAGMFADAGVSPDDGLVQALDCLVTERQAEKAELEEARMHLDRLAGQYRLLEERAEAAEAELTRLREVERRHRALGSELAESLWGEGRSLDDYGDLFDLLEAHGVIAKHPEPYDTEKHGHVHEDVAPGDEWYQLAWKIKPQPQEASEGQEGGRE